jgi:hypothetical protein
VYQDSQDIAVTLEKMESWVEVAILDIQDLVATQDSQALESRAIQGILEWDIRVTLVSQALAVKVAHPPRDILDTQESLDTQDLADREYLVTRDIQVLAKADILDLAVQQDRRAQVALADIRALVALEYLGIAVIQARAFQAILGTLARLVCQDFRVTLVR